MYVDTGFASWLTEELDKRGWSNSELARRSEVVPSTISMVISRQNQPGLDLCLGLARALHLPPEVVLRKAGLLPPEPDESELVSEMVYLVSRLDPQTQRLLVAQARALYELNQRDRQSNRQPHP